MAEKEATLTEALDRNREALERINRMIDQGGSFTDIGKNKSVLGPLPNFNNQAKQVDSPFLSKEPIQVELTDKGRNDFSNTLSNTPTDPVGFLRAMRERTAEATQISNTTVNNTTPTSLKVDQASPTVHVKVPPPTVIGPQPAYIPTKIAQNSPLQASPVPQPSNLPFAIPMPTGLNQGPIPTALNQPTPATQLSKTQIVNPPAPTQINKTQLTPPGPQPTQLSKTQINPPIPTTQLSKTVIQPVLTPVSGPKLTPVPPPTQQQTNPAAPQQQQVGAFDWLKKALFGNRDPVQENQQKAQAEVHRAERDVHQARANILTLPKDMQDAQQKVRLHKKVLEMSKQSGTGVKEAQLDVLSSQEKLSGVKERATKAPGMLKTAEETLTKAQGQNRIAGSIGGKAGAIAGALGEAGKAGGSLGGVVSAAKDLGGGLQSAMSGKGVTELGGALVKTIGSGIGMLVGGPIGSAVGGLASGLVKANEKLNKWSNELHDSNLALAEFSGAMAGVKARSDLRQLQMNQKFGDQTAASADRLEESRNRNQEAWQPFAIFFQNLGNEILSAVEDIKATVGELLTWSKGKEKKEVENLGNWADSLMQDNWTANFGRPDRFPGASENAFELKPKGLPGGGQGAHFGH